MASDKTLGRRQAEGVARMFNKDTSTPEGEEAVARGAYRNSLSMEHPSAFAASPRPSLGEMQRGDDRADSQKDYDHLRRARAETDKHYPGRRERAAKMGPAENNAHSPGKSADGKVVFSRED